MRVGVVDSTVGIADRERLARRLAVCMIISSSIGGEVRRFVDESARLSWLFVSYMNFAVIRLIPWSQFRLLGLARRHLIKVTVIL